MPRQALLVSIQEKMSRENRSLKGMARRFKRMDDDAGTSHGEGDRQVVGDLLRWWRDVAVQMWSLADPGSTFTSIRCAWSGHGVYTVCQRRRRVHEEAPNPDRLILQGVYSVHQWERPRPSC